MEVMEAVMEELKARSVYLYETYAPYYVCSFMTHAFNQMNQRREIYWDSKRVPNMRLHILFVAPAGFMKSFYMGTMGGERFSIFRNCGVPIGFEQSMCLPAGEKVNMADGSHKNIEDVQVGDLVIGYDGSLVPTEVTATHIMNSTSILTITTQDGRKLRLTGNHPLLTVNGWKKACDIELGESIAVIKHSPVDSDNEYSKHIAYLLGIMLADGNFRKMTVACANDHTLNEIIEHANAIGLNVTQTHHIPAIEYHIEGSGSGNPHPLKEEFKRIGITDACIRDTKFIPEEVFTWNNRAIAYFLRGLFTGDGHVNDNNIVFANLSENLVRGTQELLLRFGIISKVWYDDKNCIWKVAITSYEDIKTFCTTIGFSYPIDIKPKKENSSMGDLPPETWDVIDKYRKGMSWNKLSKILGKNITQAKYKRNRISHETLRQIAKVLNSADLMDLSNPDIAWMKVTSVKHEEGELVYNLSTECKTFVANNIITHNTEAAFVGTIRDIDGVGHPTLGAAADYKDGMLLIDEFSALTNAMKVQYNSQMDAQLLAALDHGHVVKRLGTGRIEYTTNLTLWAGVQPAKYDLSSGLGRRMCFLLFLPTKLDNIALMRTMHKTRNIRPDIKEMDNLWGLIKNSVSNMERIETIDFGDSVLKLYEELNLFSYESSYFDRLLLGWHLATYGPEPHMMIEAQDKELLQLVNREKKWRDEIAAGVDHAQMMKIIKACGSSIDGKIQISKPDLIQECTMVGWNARQVADVLTELTRFGMIENHGSRVVVLE